MPQRILVTGATGTVGGAVLRQLQAHPDAADLRGTARSAAAAARLRATGIQPVTFDFDRPDTLRPALRGVDAVFLATGYSVDMLVQSKQLLDAARAEGVRHIVHLGALAPDDTGFAHFAWHQMIERAIAGMGFGWTHLHPNFFMETVWQGLRHRPDRLVHFFADRPVSWIAADDIAAVAAQALLHPDQHAGQTYPLASERLTGAQVATTLAQVLGHPVTYAPRPAATLRAILDKSGMDPGYAAALSESVAAVEAGHLPGCDAVFDTVQRVTGRAPILWADFARARKDQITATGRSVPS